jgi:hypothetical protein
LRMQAWQCEQCGKSHRTCECGKRGGGSNSALIDGLYFADHRPFATGFDVLLILFCIYAALHWTFFAGGFGWFLLLGLSPRAWR